MSADHTSPLPRPASTLVLCRPAQEAQGFEVLLVKRHGKSGFMAGAHVFPGGRVEEDDGMFASSIGTAASALLDGLAAERASAFVAAAVRETEEEAGISLRRDGLPDVDALRPLAWWITPEAEPKRFDTRFFIAEVARDTAAVVDAKEAVDHAWLTPRAALEAYARGEVVLAPPTLCTLEDLAPWSSVQAAVDAVRRPIRPVCPRLVLGDDGSVTLALPGDLLHEDPTPVFAQRTRVVRGLHGRFASAHAPARREP